ncbi:N-acetyltransferase [Candidimonas nitroreducens]|uniref:N-acetyltransferase n=1 Tax=Candidimonas nitroreducens TaxID=683354 RepID=A0A225MLE0_9BURK|nr:N-acetyltransferase [Candidimonas nitroreducens]
MRERLDCRPFKEYAAIGIEDDGELIGGIIFDSKWGASIQMHVASNGSRHWMTAAGLAACFGYAFNQEKVNIIVGLVRADNIEARRFDEHLGFKQCGQLPLACTDGTDLIVYGMRKSDCRYLQGKYHAELIAELRDSGSSGPRLPT